MAGVHEMVERALRRQRAAVLVAVVFGIGYGLTLGRADDGLLLFPFVLLLLVGGGISVFRRPGRERLAVDPTVPAMYAPPRRLVPFRAYAVAWLVAQVVDHVVRWEEQDRLWWPLLVGSVVLAALLTVDLWRQVPMVTFTPQGIGTDGPRQTVFVPWSALAVDELVLAPDEGRALRLPLARPELVERRGRWWWPARWSVRSRPTFVFPAHEVASAPEYLAGTVRHYLARPEHRPAIGTVEEYARLPRACGGGGPAAG